MCGHLLLSLIVSGFGNSKKSVEVLSPSNAEQLKQVFFSGDPWLVQCASKTDLAAAAAADGLGAHETVELVLPLLKEAKVGLLDCNKRLPSGKNTMERFKLDGSISPVLMLIVNGKAPLQLTPALMSKQFGTQLFPSPRQQAVALAALVRARSEPKAFAFTKTEHLQSHCMSGKKKQCALVLAPREIQGESARIVKGLMSEFRTIVFATVNTDRYEFSLAKHLPPAVNGTNGKPLPQLLALQSILAEPSSAKGKKPSKQKSFHLSAKAHRGEWALKPLRSFVSDLLSGSLEMAQLKKAPQLRWRRRSEDKDVKEARGSTSRRTTRASDNSRDTKGGRAARAADTRGKGSKSSKDWKAERSAEEEGAQRENEQERRRKMAEEEEEALKSMFADADDEGDESEEEAEESLDLDETDGDDEGRPDGPDEEGEDTDADFKDEM